MSLISISTPINLYTTPLLIFWQQFRPPEIYNHTCDSRLRHSARAEAKVVPPLLLLTSFHSGVILLRSRSLCSHSTRSWHHFIKEHTKLGNITFQYIPTTENIADILTKALPQDTLCKFIYRIGLNLRVANMSV